jgi:hypothetical protein
MPQDVYYRYFNHPDEISQLHRERMVHTTNPHNGYKTWFTPTRFNDPAAAQQLLALDYVPQYRVGPIRADEMPDFDVHGPQIIQPVGNFPGGAIEVCTTQPVFIFGCYNFATSDWEDL